MIIKDFGFQIRDKKMFTDKYLIMYKYYAIFFLLILSCKEKISLKEVILHENIIKEIEKNRNSSNKPGVYIVSLFKDKNKNICEIVKYKEALPVSNFGGCQIINRDTIFLYTNNNFSKCYRLLNRKIYFEKREPILGNKKEIGYYIIDTVNCRLTKFIPDKVNKNSSIPID